MIVVCNLNRMFRLAGRNFFHFLWFSLPPVELCATEQSASKFVAEANPRDIPVKACGG